MTDEEFFAFCEEHPDLFFETTADGELIVMPAPHSLTGVRNSEIGGQLTVWSRGDGRGFVTDSSTGFVLPNGARRSPDAAWTPKSEIAKLPRESREGYWHLCPAFVIELRSQSDRLRVLRQKMREYIDNGAQLGWLIDAEARSVEIYRPNREPELREGIESLSGEPPVAGFTLDLRTVWDPFAS
jgi:Uma2 family endonuclease